MEDSSFIKFLAGIVEDLKFVAVFVFFPLSGIALISALFLWLKYGKHIDWQLVQGTIVFSGVTKYLSTGARNVLWQGAVEGKVYEQTIEYSYLVNGKEYINNVIRLGQRLNIIFGKENAREIHLKCKTGSSIIVYFDPQNPANSALDINYVEHRTLIKMGVLYGAIGGVLWLISTYTSLP